MLHPDEITAQNAVVARLLQRFPDAPAAWVKDAVTAGFEGYVHARVRDFIELLVERDVAAELRARRSPDVRWSRAETPDSGELVSHRTGDRQPATM